nr:MAG TPA: hypothetical protein [Caudoviricetes sp.]
MISGAFLSIYDIFKWKPLPSHEGGGFLFCILHS